MAITVDWANKIINIPKADLTLVQTNPTEIRSMDINWFRLTLKDLEDDFNQGMPFLDTHRHNTEVSVGGVTLARVVEIINGYTVTFEDGQYAVNLYGANSNVGDVVNVNQVSVRSANSAGLVTSQAIEYGEYRGGVTVDILAGEAGTIYPVGTQRRPVNNISDALLIAQSRGFDTLFIIGDIIFDTGDDISGYKIIGQSQIKTTITINAGAVTDNCDISNATVTGNLDGGTIISSCTLVNLNYVNGRVFDSMISAGTIYLGGATTAHFIDCYSGVPGSDTPIIDMNGSGAEDTALAMRNYSGGIKLIQKTGIAAASIDINSGQVIIDSTCTAGSITVRGVGKLTDNSAAGCTVNASNFLQAGILQEEIERSSYSDVIAVDQLNGSSGTTFPIGTHRDPVNNFTDANTISDDLGIEVYILHGDILITTGDTISDKALKGENALTTVLTIDSGASLTNVQYEDMFINNSTVSNISYFKHCNLSNLTNFSGYAENCMLHDTISIAGTNNSYFVDCKSGCVGLGTTDLPKIDMTGTDRHIAFRNFAGPIKILNSTNANNTICLDITSGADVIIDSSCTAGKIFVRGIANINNSGTMTITKVANIEPYMLQDIYAENRLTVPKFLGLK